MWFIVVEVEQETSAPPPKKNPGSAPVPWVRLLRTKNDEKSKDYCKATAKLIQKNVYCFFITIFRLTIPAFFT